MANMVAARSDTGFEFFAQPRQKTFARAAQATYQNQKANTHKKARREAGCKVQGNLEELEKLTVVGCLAV
jgi:hypothetical protein